MKRKRLIAVVLAILLIVVLVPWFAGTLLTSPVQREVGNLPADLVGRSVDFPSESGSMIRGWFLPGRAGIWHNHRDLHLGRLLRDMWSCKTARDFPGRPIVLSFDEEFSEDLVDYQITFYHKR